MPKNVILLHSDQQRADSLGCRGNPLARTPNLDRLAAGGTLFTRHVVGNPICSPSRASLLTGLYPPGHNVWCNGVALNRREYAAYDSRNERERSQTGLGGFVPEPQTMADVFAAAGYRTASFGKLHLTPYLAPESYGYPETTANWSGGLFADWQGPYYGFQRVALTLGHGEGTCHAGHYGEWLKREHPDALARLSQERAGRLFPEIGDLYASSLPFELHHTHWLAQQLVEYLRSRREGEPPFFAFVGFPDPHHPFTPCREIAEAFENLEVPDPVDPEGHGMAGSPVLALNQQRLDGTSAQAVKHAVRYTHAMVHQLDLAVGMIVGALREAGLLEDTVIAFTSDHGDYLGDHGHLRKGVGASNSLLHVPLVLHAPGSGLPPQVDLPVSNCDVLPTLAALAGVAAPAGLHGRDLAEVVRAGNEHYAFAFSANGDPNSVNHTVYDAAHRLTWYPASDFVELFDHRADPGECRNVAGEPQYRDTVADLTQLLARRLSAFYNPMLARVCAW